MAEEIGGAFVRALAARDVAGLTGLMAPGIDFRGLTPGRFWAADRPEEVIDVPLGNWFEEHDRVDDVSQVESTDVADTHRIGYRFAVTTPDGPHLVEQQAYYRVDDGTICYLRIVCSGFRPVASA